MVSNLLKLKCVVFLLLIAIITACTAPQERNTETSTLANNFDAAVPIVRQPPQYPRQAALDGIEGYVTLFFFVDENGRPRDIKVVDSDPIGIFEQSAIQALYQWRFPPPENPGKTHLHRLDFTLE